MVTGGIHEGAGGAEDLKVQCITICQQKRTELLVAVVAEESV